MNDSYRYFKNRACQYYPCHKGIEELNCLFCYCPLYTLSVREIIIIWKRTGKRSRSVPIVLSRISRKITIK